MLPNVDLVTSSDFLHNTHTAPSVCLSVCLSTLCNKSRATVRILDICCSRLRSQSFGQSACTSSTCFAYCLYFSAVLFMQSVDGSILDSIALLLLLLLLLLFVDSTRFNLASYGCVPTEIKSTPAHNITCR